MVGLLDLGAEGKDGDAGGAGDDDFFVPGPGVVPFEVALGGEGGAAALPDDVFGAGVGGADEVRRPDAGVIGHPVDEKDAAIDHVGLGVGIFGIDGFAQDAVERGGVFAGDPEVAA